MDPVLKLWYFYHWLADKTEQAEFANNHAYLLASFWNPEAVKNILNHDNKHISDDDDFEESLKMVKNFKKPEEINNIKEKKKKRKIIV